MSKSTEADPVVPGVRLQTRARTSASACKTPALVEAVMSWNVRAGIVSKSTGADPVVTDPHVLDPHVLDVEQLSPPPAREARGQPYRQMIRPLKAPFLSHQVTSISNGWTNHREASRVRSRLSAVHRVGAGVFVEGLEPGRGLRGRPLRKFRAAAPGRGSWRRPRRRGRGGEELVARSKALVMSGRAGRHRAGRHDGRGGRRSSLDAPAHVVHGLAGELHGLAAIDSDGDAGQLREQALGAVSSSRSGVERG